MEDFYLMSSTPDPNRSEQGKVLPTIPPFDAPAKGELSSALSFGVVQRTATGPSDDSDIETLFANTFSLSKGNTALPGGTFFVENRAVASVDTFGVTGISGAASGSPGRPDLSVIQDWLFYARGFTNSGFSGTTSAETPIVGVPRGLTLDPVGNTLSDLYVHPMDLPTVPYGNYGDLTGYDSSGQRFPDIIRQNNKVLLYTGTGATASATFRAANTDMLFSMLNMPGITGTNRGADTNGNPPTLVVQNISTVFTNHAQSGSSEGIANFETGNVVGGSVSGNQLGQLNRGSQEIPPEDQYVINGSTDLCFFMGAANNNLNPNAITESTNRPIGNVLKCEFPVPVRGFAVASADNGRRDFNGSASVNPDQADAGRRGTRLFIEGDFVDGTTFSYVMFNRGGVTTNVVSNEIGVGSYLALNSRTDKHIKRLYFSIISYDPYISGHIDHGPIDQLGPAKFYENGKVGNSGEYKLVEGLPTVSGASTTQNNHLHRDQDDMVIKLSVMPKYDQNYFQLEKRPGGGLNNYGETGAFNNRASFNEWRKITKNQLGKTFGKTGAVINAFGGINTLGHGVTFVSGAVTGSTLGISMKFIEGGDLASSGLSIDGDEVVEAFEYEVIKGATVDGAFVPVWKKTRTI